MTRRGDCSDGPVRMCIGCRQRAAAAELLRVVVAPAPVGQQGQASEEFLAGPSPLFAVPDPRSRAPGRGAWLHRDPDCARTAERRRAFARALRVPGVDPAPVLRYVDQLGVKQRSDSPVSRK